MYISPEALAHAQGMISARLFNAEIREDIPYLGKTNEEVRKYMEANLWNIALTLRLEITKYDKENKKMLFMVSLIVTSSIIVLTYLNGLAQHILKTGKTVNYLVIFSTIIGFNYEKQEPDSTPTCIGDSLLPFICLFLLLAYDVYVIRVINALETEIKTQLAELGASGKEVKLMLDKDDEDEMDKEQQIAKKSIFSKRKRSDDSDSEEQTNHDFSDLYKLSIGADLNERKFANKSPDDMNIDDDKNLELYLLDDQDRQEIRIKALKAGNETGNLAKYTGYESLKELDLHPWNFYEFYDVAKVKDHATFLKYLREMRRLNKKMIDSESDSNESNDENDDNDSPFLDHNIENVSLCYCRTSIRTCARSSTS